MLVVKKTEILKKLKKDFLCFSSSYQIDPSIAAAQWLALTEEEISDKTTSLGIRHKGQ